MKKFLNFLKDEEGITAIEYGILAALIAVGVTTAVAFITSGMNKGFEKIGAKMTPAE
ncbi:MAG: Flp family type IVb pilin [Candidatus Jettenia sp.]|nr:Flp family type IVb pilin [Candidatus Jettenia sp.]